MSPADRAVWFINNLTLTEEFSGQPMLLRPWQESFVRQLYRVNSEGKREVRQALLLLPRKQAKTQLCACIALEHLINTKVRGRCALVGAADRKQAGFTFDKAKRIIQADPELDRRCRILNNKQMIEVKATGNYLRVIAGDGRLAHGDNPSLVIIDELHAHRNHDLYNSMTSSFGTRSDYLVLMISTQGNRKDSLVYEKYTYACKVRDGLVDDPTFLPMIFEAPPDSDWREESTWYAAMPAQGDFYHLDFIRSEFRKALEMPSEESKFRQLYLNQLVASESKWLNAPKWALCGERQIDPESLKGKRSWWGLDLSSTSDITALVGVVEVEGGLAVVSHFWIPETYARLRAKRDKLNYVEWQRQGKLTFTSGDEIDYPKLEEEIPKILSQYQCRILNVDPYNATSTTQRLASLGLPVQKHRQGWMSMSPAIKHLDVLISKGQIFHGNHPVLTWCAENAVVDRDKSDNLTWSKKTSADKIDGVVALTMAVSGAMADSRKVWVYESQGMEVIGAA